MRSKKVKNDSEIRKVVQNLKEKGKKIVTCNGTFDLFHAGHLYFLSEARKQGDRLIVGLNSDRSVKLNKGPARPLVHQKHRAALLAGLECVDYVILFDERDPRRLLSLIRPNVHCNGVEYGKNCIEAATVKRFHGKLKLIKAYGAFRTTKLIEKIRRAGEE